MRTKSVSCSDWTGDFADLAAYRRDSAIGAPRVFETMNVTRSFAVAATFAAVAVGAAAPASAAPVMSGHYIKTTTDSTGGGRTFTEHWYFTPCGDGCADMSSPAAGGGARAMLVNGQWAMDSIGDVVCKDSTTEGNAANTHYTWDPNTLAGTVQVIQKQAVCDHAPQSYTLSFQLTKAP